MDRLKRSLYDKTIKKAKQMPQCHTVAQLKKALEGLPDNLPISPGNFPNGGVKPVWFNFGRAGGGGNGEHLSFEEEWDDE